MEKLGIKELAILKSFLDYLVSNSKQGEVSVTVPKYTMLKNDYNALLAISQIVSRAFWDKEINS